MEIKTSSSFSNLDEPEDRPMEDRFEVKPMEDMHMEDTCEDVFIENEPEEATDDLIDTFEKLNEKSMTRHVINFTDSELGIYRNTKNEVKQDPKYKIVSVVSSLCIQKIYDNPHPYVEEIDSDRARFTFFRSLDDKVMPCVNRLKDGIRSITVNGELLDYEVRWSLLEALNKFSSFYSDIEGCRHNGIRNLKENVVYKYVKDSEYNDVYTPLYEDIAELILSKF